MPRRMQAPHPGLAWSGWLASFALCAAIAPIASPAQGSVTLEAPSRNPKGPTGIVTGTVYCADTNAPARLAQVTLIAQSGYKIASPQNVGTVDLDGHFAIGKVPEGKYFVSVKQAGYLDPTVSLKDKNLEALNETAGKNLEKRLVAVTVSAKQPVDVSVRLERAAEIDGTVLYDDGSPAVGLHIELKTMAELAQATRPPDGVTSLADYAEEFTRSTDDHGHYRILGVSPGEFAVSVTVPAASGEEVARNPIVSVIESNSVGALTVFYGDVFRASKARPVKIEAAGSTASADITIPLSKLHTIRGHVVLKSTGDPPPAGAVTLLYADTHENARLGIFDGSGEFALSYVPEDSYILTAAASPEPLPDFSEEDLGGAYGFSASFRADSDAKLPDGMSSLPLLVTGDVTGITISVPDPPPLTREKSSDRSGPDIAPQPSSPDQPVKPQPRE